MMQRRILYNSSAGHVTCLTQQFKHFYSAAIGQLHATLCTDPHTASTQVFLRWVWPGLAPNRPQEVDGTREGVIPVHCDAVPAHRAAVFDFLLCFFHSVPGNCLGRIEPSLKHCLLKLGGEGGRDQGRLSRNLQRRRRTRRGIFACPGRFFPKGTLSQWV
jgi:hypothetical protein